MQVPASVAAAVAAAAAARAAALYLYCRSVAAVAGMCRWLGRLHGVYLCFFVGVVAHIYIYIYIYICMRKCIYINIYIHIYIYICYLCVCRVHLLI